MKRIVVCGSREYENYEEAKAFLEEKIGKIKKGEAVILSGGCRGADAIGERYAEEKGYLVECFPAEWSKYGRGAGIRRNREMAALCDMAICFWDGKSRGTASLIEFATKLKKQVLIKRIEKEGSSLREGGGSLAVEGACESRKLEESKDITQKT